MKTHGLLRGFLGPPLPAESGAAVLFCHANGFCKEVWLPVVEELSDIFRAQRPGRVDCIIPDLPGHGDRSTDDLRDATGWIDSMSAHVARHANEYMTCHPRRVGVGMSLGGAALLIAQHKNPALFTDLILMEPVVGQSADGSQPLTVLHSPDSPLAAATRRRRSSFDTITEAEEFFKSRKVFSNLDERCIRQLCLGGLKEKTKLKSTERSDQKPSVGLSLAAKPAFEAEILTRFPVFSPVALRDLGRGGCRIVLAAGSESDFMGGAEDYYLSDGGLKGWIGGCSAVLLEGCSHFAPLEKCHQVAEMIASTILERERKSSRL